MHQKVSNIQVVPINASDGLIGFVSFIYDDNFYLGGIGIYTRPQGGIRLTFPTRSHYSGALNVYYPINKTIAEYLEQAVEEKFKAILKK